MFQGFERQYFILGDKRHVVCVSFLKKELDE
jgi:hypothetical protein